MIKDSKGKMEKRMLDWDAVFKNGQEWSFEEVRARERGLLGKEWRGAVKDWETSWHLPGCESGRKILSSEGMLTTSVHAQSFTQGQKDAVTDCQHQTREPRRHGHV